MSAPTITQPSRRDLALLRAVDAGRCELLADCGPVLIVDGGHFCDQLAARRLVEAGLLDGPAGRVRTPARLTAAGRGVLAGS